MKDLFKVTVKICKTERKDVYFSGGKQAQLFKFSTIPPLNKHSVI